MSAKVVRTGRGVGISKESYDLESSLMKLLSAPTEKIRILPDKLFVHPEGTWNEQIVSLYFLKKLDLFEPIYTDFISSLPLNGLQFFSFHEKFPFPDFPFAHPMHALKIYLHAEQLRNSSYDQIDRKGGLPKYLEDWKTVHIAYYLMKEKV
jgi:hypothetical protein